MIESMGKYKDEEDYVCIAHGDAIDDANYLAKLVKDALPHKQIIINTISLVLGLIQDLGLLVFALWEKNASNL